MVRRKSIHYNAALVLNQVRHTLKKRCLMQRGDKVLVACSGGGDSVALVHILAHLSKELELCLMIASVDHGLRKESAQEVSFVSRLALKLGIDFFALHVDVYRHSNVQSCARDVRYRALKQLARDKHAACIALGHTLDDQAETAFVRLVRGFGLWGLNAIHPMRDDRIIRPLIDCRRAWLRQYLMCSGISWIEDPSNQDVRFERTLVRQIMPSLEAFDDNATSHLAQITDDIRSLGSWLEQHVKDWLHTHQKSNALNIQQLLALPSFFKREVFRHWLIENIKGPVRRVYLDALEHMVDQNKGYVLLGSNWAATISPQGQLVLERACPHTRYDKKTDVALANDLP